jgi:hypothetical protein
MHSVAHAKKRSGWQVYRTLARPRRTTQRVLRVDAT